jgi:hypothetical protein
MRYYFVLTLVVITALSCKHSNPGAPADNGVIVASVIQGFNEPEPGKQIELLQMKQTKTTDDAGQVFFSVPPGTYTVRAYGLNHGGPVVGYMDSVAVVTAGDTTRIAFWDCPLCD